MNTTDRNLPKVDGAGMAAAHASLDVISAALKLFPDSGSVPQLRTAQAVLATDAATERGALALQIANLLMEAFNKVPMWALRHIWHFLNFTYSVGFKPVASKEARAEALSRIEGFPNVGAVAKLEGAANFAGKVLPPEVSEAAMLLLTDALQEDAETLVRPMPWLRLLQLAIPGAGFDHQAITPEQLQALRTPENEQGNSIEDYREVWARLTADRDGGAREEIFDWLHSVLAFDFPDLVPDSAIFLLGETLLQTLEDAAAGSPKQSPAWVAPVVRFDTSKIEPEIRELLAERAKRGDWSYFKEPAEALLSGHIGAQDLQGPAWELITACFDAIPQENIKSFVRSFIAAIEDEVREVATDEK